MILMRAVRKFSRTTFMPARQSSVSTSSEEEAGPIVHTILVFLI